jgi:thiamine monophosphate kinase
MLDAYAEAARQYGIEIVGGDFSRAEKLTISVTAIGRVVTRPLLRSGAKPAIAFIYRGRSAEPAPASL